MFMKDVFKVAPLLNSVDTDEPHSELAVGNPKGPVVLQDAKMLQLLAKPVTVSKFLFLLLLDRPCLMFGACKGAMHIIVYVDDISEH